MEKYKTEGNEFFIQTSHVPSFFQALDDHVLLVAGMRVSGVKM